MGITKVESYTKRQNELALFLKAIAHPARIAIIDYLLKHNSCICNDIVNELPLAQATISQHLKELKNVGIIKGNIEGNSICYCINVEIMQKGVHFFNEFIEKLNKQKNNCC